MAGTQFADLTGSSGHRILVTLGAALGVVHRAQTVLDRFPILKCVERLVEFLLSDEPVGEVVETRRCLGWPGGGALRDERQHAEIRRRRHAHTRRRYTSSFHDALLPLGVLRRIKMR